MYRICEMEGVPPREITGVTTSATPIVKVYDDPPFAFPGSPWSPHTTPTATWCDGPSNMNETVLERTTANPMRGLSISCENGRSLKEE